MPKPADWKGSDGRARAEVALWLELRGGEVDDPHGLIVGQMKAELGKGRALSQLLADMEHDGMLEREVRGRRTLSIRLVDDWGLIDEWRDRLAFSSPVGLRRPQSPARGASVDAASVAEPDYDRLAAVLLERVIKQAHAQPSQGAELERLKAKVAQLTAERDEARERLSEALSGEVEQRRAALDPKDRALLDRLMREVPQS